jgi:hypothetical protein
MAGMQFCLFPGHSGRSVNQERGGGGWFYSSGYLTPMLCRNLRSSGVSTVGLAFDFVGFAGAPVKQSRQQSDSGFTTHTFL